MSAPTPAEASLLAQARAKLVWGARPTEIRALLAGKGVDPLAIEQLIETSLAELRAERRAKGVRDLVIGVPLVLVGAWGEATWWIPGASIWLVIIAAIPGAVGLLLGWRALDCFIGPAAD